MNRKKYLLIMTAVIMLLVPSCTMTPNHPPIITSLEAEAETVFPSGSCQIVCTASDPDGDELSYKWSTSGGDIYVTGHEVTWTAPEEVGIYSITVVVDDDYGGSATGTLTISVATGQPPVIESLLVTAEHKYLKKTTSGYLVGEGKDFRIQCTASHPDGFDLSYEWECDGGEISGEGSIITWTAPNRGVYVTVTVVVSDVAGNMATKSVGLDVRSCSEFG